jgi:F-box protein 11
MNKVNKCQESGIHIIAKNTLRSDAVVKYNWVEKNLEDGIHIEGDQNYTRVEKNHHICNNRKSGIKASDRASVVIVNNQIFSNYGQGILIVDTASAYVEKNEIHQNYKANIAYGGANSADTVILNNLIYKSRSEGIFCIEGGFSWIKHNDIYDNSDGIILFDSCTQVSNN